MSTALQLRPKRPLWDPLNLGRAAHACFLRFVGRIDPQLAQSLHHSEVNPFTLSILMDQDSDRRSHPAPLSRSLWLRITSLDERLSALLQGLEPEQVGPLRLLSTECSVLRVLRVDEKHPWARRSTFSELSNNGLLKARSGETRVGLRFVTPTAFSIAESRLSMPLPWPRLVFQSLARHWNASSPIRRWINWPEFDLGVSVSEHRLQTHRLDLGRYSEVGFTGECWYVVDRDASLALRQAVHALSEFAFFAGVGKKTSMGMGVAVPVESGKRRSSPSGGQIAGRHPHPR